MAPAGKTSQRCTNCGRRGHSSRNPLCPDNIASAAADKALNALADELDLWPGAAGTHDAGVAVDAVAAAARAAARKATS
jgi:hypothetical protein